MGTSFQLAQLILEVTESPEYCEFYRSTYLDYQHGNIDESGLATTHYEVVRALEKLVAPRFAKLDSYPTEQYFVDDREGLLFKMKLQLEDLRKQLEAQGIDTEALLAANKEGVQE